MNYEQMAHKGINLGQRLRLAAVKVGEIIGMGGLLTAIAVEGGAALNVNTPAVQEAEAGTGITGLEISDSGCGAGEFSRLVVVNNRQQDINLTLTDKSNGQSFDVIQGAKQRNTYPYVRGTTVESRIKQAPGEVDLQKVCAEAPTSTTSSTTTTTTITISAPNATTTTTSSLNTSTSLNTIITVPRGQDVKPPVATGPTTTTTNFAGAKFTNTPTGNESTFSQNSSTTTLKTAKPAISQTGRQLALGGNETEKMVRGGVAMVAIGSVLLVLGRRKKQQASA